MTQAAGPAGSDTDAVISLTGRFADRDAWQAEGWCRIEHALELIGTRSAMILMREIYYGGRRFDDLARRTGLTEAVAAKRLKQLVADGLLQRRPYQDPGKRTRYEYVLTDLGRDLFPVLVALIQWGERLGRPGGVELVHVGCGSPLGVVVSCAKGHEVALPDTAARLVADGDGASAS
ncbi:winged helix DNA-binding protein [Micromonospora terminaliae]|uniref:Helix-turn-helix transcriptional regulator n=1 Tax=Micromonospora terminaliae TaxID=1914461 RepID=A0AAJ2ZK06_9ACTN|nr:helix-turn-helix domain-containing protein [Micromonospora terminaliae]NES31245.1 helix-turn-helix transcriptional regulator [Micromonospora terminaliae]QGL46613.1 winged helix DNA-binding protein [Micromonospora terminaliae]